LKKRLEKQNSKKTGLGVFVTGKRGNYDINEKSYGVDAAIALVNNPDRIYPKDFAIPDTVFENHSFEPIKISGIKDVSSIIPSELVFKVGRTTGLTKGCIDDSLTSIVVDGKFSIYNQQSSMLGEVLMEKIELKGETIFPSIRLDRQILVQYADDEMFMKHGDSGCTWFDQKGKIIALGHGILRINNLNKDYSVGSPINAVLEALEIRLYLGE